MSRQSPGLSRFAASVLFIAAAITTGQAAANETGEKAFSRGDQDRTATGAPSLAPASRGLPPHERPALPPEEWLQRVLNATRNGLPLKHPEAFVEWLDAVSEPRFMTALATVAVGPTHDRPLPGMAIDPNATLSWTEFTDPALYLRWLAAGTSPAFFKAIFDRMANPGKLMRWIQASQAMAPLLSRFHPAAGPWAAAFPPPATTEARLESRPESMGKASQSGQDWQRLPVDYGRGLHTAIRSYRY